MRLEDLLDRKFPHASFHDALLNRLTLDYLLRTATFDMELCVGNPESESAEEREAHAKGVLSFKNFIFCTIEAPDPGYNFMDEGGLWITSDGPISKLKGDICSDLMDKVPKDAFAHYFFNSDWNSFIYISAYSAEFKWK
jgi:hypothetical protein